MSVQMTLGHATHSLRKNWYLDSFDNFLENEPLGDYRRHGLDALITAVKPQNFVELTKWNRYEQNSPETSHFPGKVLKKTLSVSFMPCRLVFNAQNNVTIAVRNIKKAKPFIPNAHTLPVVIA